MRPITTYICYHCGRECKNEVYATTRQGAKVCDDCVLRDDLHSFETEAKVFGYLQGKGKSVTNWPGNKLAKVIAEWEAQAGHCGKQTYILAITESGRLLSGRGPGRGMYCTLRPIKHWPKGIYRRQPEYSKFVAYTNGKKG